MIENISPNIPLDLKIKRRAMRSSNVVNPELKELGIAALPQRTPNSIDQSLGWQTIEDQYKVLKTIEHLLNKSKRIESDVITKNDNVLDPMSATTKQQETRIEQLRLQESQLNEQIKLAKKELASKKQERKDLQTRYAKELKELDQMIQKYMK